MSFKRQHLATSPTYTSPPASPWRARADILRRRPLRFRQLAFIAVSIVLFCTFVSFSRYHRNDRTEWIIVEDGYPPSHANAPAHVHDQQKPPAMHMHPALANAPARVEAPAQAQVPSHMPDTQADYMKEALEPIVFSLIMFSEDSANEGAILMKSILMYSSAPVEFHIICDEAAQAYLEKRFRLITRPAHDILVRFYLLPWESMVSRIERDGSITSDHSAGTPGLMKLFIHEILPDTIKRAIFIDTDAFFITDPALLWDFFARLKSTTAIAMPTHPDQSAEEWHHANRICSCIMLLDLARLRELRMMDSSVYRDAPGSGPRALAPAAFTRMFGPPGEDGRYRGVKLGDQGYWWAIVSYYGEIFEHLSFEWEMSSCLMDMYFAGLGHDDTDEASERAVQVHTKGTPHEGEVVLPKMLHFNCLDGTPHYYEWEGWSDPTNSLTQRWWPAVQYHVGFKWLWLNAHRATNATMRIQTVKDIVFADERYAQSLRQP